jgi:hypothetical protein
MHDKIPAIDKLARVLGMYRDQIDVPSDPKQIVPVLVYNGAPDRILARKAGNASPPEAGVAMEMRATEILDGGALAQTPIPLRMHIK